MLTCSKKRCQARCLQHDGEQGLPLSCELTDMPLLYTVLHHTKIYATLKTAELKTGGIETMQNKKLYKHILKNLFHEQAIEIIPLLRPGWQVTQAFEIELPTLKTKEVKREPTDIEKGLTSLALPGAEVTGVIQTEWVEHTGHFERVYRVRNPETNKPAYLIADVQTAADDAEELAKRLLLTSVNLLSVAHQDVAEKNDLEEDEGENREGTLLNKGYFVYPDALCLFPQSVPEDIVETFRGQVIMEFHFEKLRIWERDAREFLNTHATTIYFLLPVMKNADAALLGIAIGELAQKFSDNETDLGRHLTGLNLLIQLSETMAQEEKLAVQAHLYSFKHLIKSETDDAAV